MNWRRAKWSPGRVNHHTRNADGTILTSIIRDGPISLDPPGITVTDCFPPEGAAAS
jgi:hypothetical protein